MAAPGNGGPWEWRPDTVWDSSLNNEQCNSSVYIIKYTCIELKHKHLQCPSIFLNKVHTIFQIRKFVRYLLSWTLGLGARFTPRIILVQLYMCIVLHANHIPGKCMYLDFTHASPACSSSFFLNFHPHSLYLQPLFNFTSCMKAEANSEWVTMHGGGVLIIPFGPSPQGVVYRIA